MTLKQRRWLIKLPFKILFLPLLVVLYLLVLPIIIATLGPASLAIWAFFDDTQPFIDMVNTIIMPPQILLNHFKYPRS